MKKVKILLLLSLALFAVVGGALAYKAKGCDELCTADAYYDPINDTYYCAFTVAAQVKTKDCVDYAPAATIDPNPVAVKNLYNSSTCRGKVPSRLSGHYYTYRWKPIRFQSISRIQAATNWFPKML